MPTVLRQGPYRFFFYAGDGSEPPHVHVERDARTAKFWIDPVRLQYDAGFRASELREIQQIIVDNQPALLEAWHGYFQD